MSQGEAWVRRDRSLELGDRVIVLPAHHVDTSQREVGDRVLVVQGKRSLRRGQRRREALVRCRCKSQHRIQVVGIGLEGVGSGETGIQVLRMAEQALGLGVVVLVEVPQVP